jgi:mono/diheme cytochrome c family protein
MKPILLLPLVAALTLAACQRDAAPMDTVPSAPNEADLIARGEYLVKTTGCNDCHTERYAEQQGNVDKSQWLTGSALGYSGPWGTTYAANLRLRINEMDEAQWLDYSGNLRTRPIMPDFNLRAMTVEDRRAMYRFIRSLGPAGQPAPAFLPPGQKPPPPYFELVLPATGDAAAPAKPAPAAQG